MTTYYPVKRYHRIDGWRGFSIPACAVAGASDTGMYSDSPCPSVTAKAEIRRFQRECLRPAKIRSRTRFGSTSNVFCGKRWVVVDREDFNRAAALAVDWLRAHERDTRFIFEADLAKTIHTLGVVGAWFVGRSRDYFSPFNEDGWTGIRVSNSCGSFVLAVWEGP